MSLVFIVTEALNVLISKVILHVVFDDDKNIGRYLDRRFRFFADEFKYTNHEEVISEVKSIRFRLSLYYLVSDFVKASDTRNANYGLIIFESANKPVQLCLFYLEVFLKVFLNKSMQLLQFLTDEHLRISGKKKFDSCFKVRKEVKFRFIKVTYQNAVELSEYFDQTFNGKICKSMFQDFEPNAV